MPKAFTETEKKAITLKLLEGASDCLTRYGIRKTTVDDLVKFAGISKGAFYLFYSSKEHLFYEVIMDCSNGLHRKFEDTIDRLTGNVTLDYFIEYVIDWIKEVESTFLIQVFQNGELEYLQRKLPEDLIRRHQIGDDELLIRLCAKLGIAQPDNIPVFAGALRSVFLTLLYKSTVGEDIYYDVLAELLRALFRDLIPMNNDNS